MNSSDKLQKLYMHEWNVHPEIFSRPQVIGNSRQYLLLQTDISQKKQFYCHASKM